jgi:hypothetical protein
MGLTSTGREMIETLLNMGAIIDIDHMPIAQYRDTLDIAERRRGREKAPPGSFVGLGAIGDPVLQERLQMACAMDNGNHF